MENPSAPFYFDDEYVLVRIYRRNQPLPMFLSESGLPVQRPDARHFSSPDAARRHISRLIPGFGLCEIVKTSDRLGPVYPFPDFLMPYLEEIPPPYLFTAMDWYAGLDMKSFLMRRSRSTYYRHRRILLEFGLDIGVPSKVVRLRN